jgi:hypothetical protein
MDKFLIGLSYLVPGQLPGSRDVTLSIKPGEGTALLEPGVTPDLGTIQEGRLILASETFPRFAPLSLTLTGADLRFATRAGRLLSFTMRDGGQDCLRLNCSGVWSAAWRHKLVLRPQDRVVVSRIHSLQNDDETPLELNLLAGSIWKSRDIQMGNGGLVEFGKVELRRDAAGELKLQLHGARFELTFGGGTLVGLRAFDSRGLVASLHVLDHTGAAVGVTVAVVDTLP